MEVEKEEMEYTVSNFKRNISSQHLNNLKFLLRSLFLSEAPCRSTDNDMISMIALILTQKSSIGKSWPWILQTLKITDVGKSEIINYLFKVSRDFMDFELVRELLLLALDSNQGLNIYERLESELNSYPLVENALIQGFAGILCLIESLKNHSLKDSMLSKAELHLKKSLQLSPLEIFEYYYVDLLERMEIRKEFLEECFRSRPQDLTISRNLFLFYTESEDGIDQDERWIQVANQILLINPVEAYTQSLQRLVDYYETRDSKRAIGYLIDRLDYNSGEIWMWNKLISLIQSLNFDFGDRANWWPQIHFNPISSSLDWNQENTLVVLAIACLYISPEMYSKSALKQRIHGFMPLRSDSIAKLEKYLGPDFYIV